MDYGAVRRGQYTIISQDDDDAPSCKWKQLQDWTAASGTMREEDVVVRLVCGRRGEDDEGEMGTVRGDVRERWRLAETKRTYHGQDSRRRRGLRNA